MIDENLSEFDINRKFEDMYPFEIDLCLKYEKIPKYTLYVKITNTYIWHYMK